MLKVEALLHDRIERLEQALLGRKRQRHQQGDLLTGQGGHTLQFLRGENFPGQTLRPFQAQQVFQVHPQPAPLRLVPDNRRSVPGAVGDRAADVRGPHRCAVLADRRDAVQLIQLLQGGAGAQAAGQELGLPLGHRALDARRRRHGAALEILRNP